jgi:pyridoxine kinase
MALPLVVSIQSQIAFGHVGNSAAALPMRACGVEVVEVPTTLLSNHPHYPTMRGRLLDPPLVADLLTGLVERGVHARATVVLSGFLGQAGIARAVADFVDAAKAANPAVTYACDPVMGDVDLGFFADEALRLAFAGELVPRADVILPNAFELAALSGIAIDRPSDVRRARAALGRMTVVATSIPVPGRPDRLATVATGEVGLLAGLVVARLALGRPLEEAVQRAVAGVAAALERTSSEAWAELPIAAALEAIVGT